MKWIIAAPYPLDLENGLWKEVKEQSKYELIACQPHYRHDRSRINATKQDWLDYWKHSSHIWALAKKNNAGIITAFPQLAVCIGLRKRFSMNKIPVIAGTFNLGKLHTGYKQKLARISLKSINKFIVHSSAELTNYSEYLEIPQNKFNFIHLHKAPLPITEAEELNSPFLLSMGTANRDYKTLFSAIERLNYPLTIVAPKHKLENLTPPKCVTIKSNLSIQECRSLVQKARLNIIPIDNKDTGSGQVTIIEAMMYKRTVIATNTVGSRDYIKHLSTGWLCESKSISELENAIKKLWEDQLSRQKLAEQAYSFICEELSHKKTASKIITLLDNL